MESDTLYTVARADGENREEDLTLADAARAILHHDGGDYEFRPRGDGDGFDLWTRQQVAGLGWTRTHWFSLETDLAAAESDIFARVLADSRLANWRGLIAQTQADYERAASESGD